MHIRAFLCKLAYACKSPAYGAGPPGSVGYTPDVGLAPTCFQALGSHSDVKYYPGFSHFVLFKKKVRFKRIHQNRTGRLQKLPTRPFLQAFMMFHSPPACCRSAGLAVAGVVAEQGPGRQSQQGTSRPKPLSSNPSQGCSSARQAVDVPLLQVRLLICPVSVVAVTVPYTRPLVRFAVSFACLQVAARVPVLLRSTPST